jgi:hypothetical protein
MEKVTQNKKRGKKQKKKENDRKLQSIPEK